MGYRCTTLHGGKGQEQREASIAGLKDGMLCLALNVCVLSKCTYALLVVMVSPKFPCASSFFPQAPRTFLLPLMSLRVVWTFKMCRTSSTTTWPRPSKTTLTASVVQVHQSSRVFIGCVRLILTDRSAQVVPARLVLPSPSSPRRTRLSSTISRRCS